jgi:hypothetical protein
MRLKFRKETEYEDKTVEEYESELSEYNSKTMDHDLFIEYVTKKIEIGNKIRTMYQNRSFRAMKLRCKIYAKKSVQHTIDKIKKFYLKDEPKDTQIVLAYGDWGRATQMRGCAPSMGKGLRTELAKTFKTLMVDEFRTSICCSYCGEKLKNAVVKKKNGEKKKLHRVLVCGCGCNNKSQSKRTTRYINRDVNACRNILKVFKSEMRGEELPQYLQRVRNDQLENEISTVVDEAQVV